MYNSAVMQAHCNPINPRIIGAACIALALLLVSRNAALAQGEIIRADAIAMHGAPKYPAGFSHFDYVNPNAPKGGSLRQGARGTFDSFNAWIDKGTPAATGSIETLMVSSQDEAFTKYCLLCESVEYPADRSWITFHLRAEARWHDGAPIMPQDVVWSFNTLMEKGASRYRFYYADVAGVEAVGARAVRFTFKTNENRELPLILGDLPILPKHYWAHNENDFTKTTLTPPLGSGPYRVGRFDPGRFVELERVADYWGAHLPVNRGINNFDILRTDYFRDRIPIRLALKSGDVDFYAENTAKSWATEFDIPSVEAGWLVKERIEHQAPQGMQAFVLNLRRAKFQNRLIRQAIGLAFDFTWTNQKIFYDQYTRTESYFSNSELASSGIPQGDELAILEPYRDQLPPELFTQVYSSPKTDGSGWPRQNLLQALDLIHQAGWEIRDGRLIDPEGNIPLQIEMLTYSSSWDRLILPYVSNLKRLGIDMKVRLVDTSQYINRVRAFDFDMLVSGWPQSESPGNEQREFWSCAAAERSGSRNMAGICHPVIDALIRKLIAARTREQLITTTRALDRVLLWGHYVVPNWHLNADRILWWNRYSRPQTPLRNGVSVARWWHDPAKAAALEEARARGEITSGRRAGETNPHAPEPSGWRLALLIAILLGGVYMVRRYFRRAAH